jgi:hypothetical protein
MRPATRLLPAAYLFALALFCAPLAARHAKAAPVADCEGDACPQITLAFDDTKQQYRAQNNSADRWAKVSASNVAASASACVAPGTASYLPLKSVVGSYSASFAEPKCGAGPGT